MFCERLLKTYQPTQDLLPVLLGNTVHICSEEWTLGNSSVIENGDLGSQQTYTEISALPSSKDKLTTLT